jgi:uncharacterized protein (UPF0332 family)/predicted nucleotidyltransferase
MPENKKPVQSGKTEKEDDMDGFIDFEQAPPTKKAASDGFSDMEPADKKKAEKPGKKEKELPLDEKKRIEILKEFSKQVLKKYGALIRSIVLFGSTARGTFKGKSDIDIFLIIDDTRHRLTPYMKEKMEWDIEDIAKSVNKLISVQQPYTLTEFWRLVRMGHPIVFNFIREGIPVYDKDIFLPIKRLLQMGEIKPSQEAVERYLDMAPKRIKRVENAKIYMVVEDCYYAMLESAQAVLMFLGKSPPRPVDAPEVLRKSLVPMKLITEEDVKILEDVILFRKDVEHKKVNEVGGAQVDEWIEKTKRFVKKMRQTIMKIEVIKREDMVLRSHSIMSETLKTLLASVNKEPPEQESGLGKMMEEDLVKPGVVPEEYLKIFSDLENMKKLVNEGKILEIPKQNILLNREYVRKFIRDAGRVIRDRAKAGK